LRPVVRAIERFFTVPTLPYLQLGYSPSPLLKPEFDITIKLEFDITIKLEP